MSQSSIDPVLSLNELDEKKRELRNTILRIIAGLICLSLSALIAVALFSYNPHDPWSYSAASNHITNLLGIYGAEVSGHLESRLGLSSWLVVITLLIWGIRGVLRIQLGAIPLRIFSAVIMLLSATTLFTMVVRIFTVNTLFWGGQYGTKIARSLAYSFTHLAGTSFGYLLTALSTLSVLIITFSLTFGFKLKEWRLFFKICHISGYHFFKFLRAIYSKLANRERRNKQVSSPATAAAQVVNEEKSFYANSSSSISFGEQEENLETLPVTEEKASKTSLLARFNPFLKKEASSTTAQVSSQKIEPTISPVSNTVPSTSSINASETIDLDPITPEPDIEIETPRAKQAIEISKPVEPAPVSHKAAKERFMERYRYDWKFPTSDLLDPPKAAVNAQSPEELQAMASKLDVSMKDYQIRGQVTKAHAGPVVTLYEVQLDRGEKKSRLLNAAVDISRDMEIDGEIRIIDLDGKSTLGVEVPNTHRQMIQYSSLLNSQEWKNTQDTLPMILGVDIMGKPMIADLAAMPHLLVAGATGAGKSVAINTMLVSLLYRLKPEECKLILIDPKIVELAVYNDLPHLLTPVLNDPTKVLGALTWAENEMNSRYDALKQHNVRNIASYNQSIDDIKKGLKPSTRKVQDGFDQTGRPVTKEVDLPLEKLPFIVIVIDEWADLYLQEGVGKKIEVIVNRLAAKARAAGLHIILATQRPSTDVLSGTIRNNFPARIAFRVSSNHDSRTIINTFGAENLLGKGDMLFKENAFKMPRLQGAFLSDLEVERVTQFLRDQRPAFYDQDLQAQMEAADDQSENDKKSFSAIKSEEDDELYNQCLEIIAGSTSISTSSLQRQMRLGYNRAANIIDRLESDGYISSQNGSKPREVIKRPNLD